MLPGIVLALFLPPLSCLKPALVLVLPALYCLMLVQEAPLLPAPSKTPSQTGSLQPLETSA